jgi:hypothetical protein
LIHGPNFHEWRWTTGWVRQRVEDPSPTWPFLSENKIMQASLIGETLANYGGQFRTFIATGASTTTVKVGLGRLCRISITTAGTASFTAFDNTSGSGSALYVSPATTSAGQVFDIHMPAQLGITIVNQASGPAFVASFN